MTIIRASAIEVVNSSGAVVIRIGTSQSGNAIIELINPDNELSQIVISAESDRASMGFLDTDGSTLVGIGSQEGNGGISILDKANRQIRIITTQAGS